MTIVLGAIAMKLFNRGERVCCEHNQEKWEFIAKGQGWDSVIETH